MGHHTFWGFCLLACLAGTSMGEGIQGRATCPEEAIYYEGQCYQLVANLRTWDAAEIECQQLRRGGHLASFQTAAEERFVSSYVQRIGYIPRAWIGMHTVQVGKILNWRWTDGTPYTPGSPLWDGRTPSTSINTNKCIYATNMNYAGYAARWDQDNCVTLVPFICKYESFIPNPCRADEQTASSSLGSI